MRRTVLWILGIAAALVVLVLAGVAIAIATVDPARFVEPLATRVKATTGRDLTVQGPVRIAFSLQPKIVLSQVSFANAPWARSPAMLTANRVEAEIALLPLLSRRFEVIEFALVDPVIDLETDANGRGNWEFAPQGGAGAAAAASPSSPPAIGVGSFQVHNGKVTYRNGANGRVTSASIDAMSLRARDMSSPVAVDFRGTVADIPVAVSGDLGAPELWLRGQSPYPLALKGDVAGKATRVEAKIARDGKVITLGDLSASYAGVVATGSIRIADDKGRSKYIVDLHIPSLAIAQLSSASTAPKSTTGSAGKPEPANARYVIPDTPLPPIPLIGLDSEGSVGIDDLVLRDGAHVRRIDTKFTSNGDGIDATYTIGELFGGSMRGRLRVDLAKQTPRIRASVEAQDLDLPTVAAKAGIHRDIHGGRLRANVDIDAHGGSPHAIASTMSGSILAVSGPASLGRGAGRGEDALAQLFGALDPLSNVDNATELRCAVFRLPLENGIARVDRSIAIETARASASASGTLNFRDETLDLSVHPQLHEGVKIDVSQFANLVRIRGSFAKPAVGIDAANAAKTIAEIGVLGASGAGVAAIGRALIAPSVQREDVCAVALGQHPAKREPAANQTPAARSSSRPSSPPPLPSEVGKALGKLFGR
jgi:AsmA family protein